MLNVHVLTLGELSTNCYLVSCPETQETVIIDPADSGTSIIDTVLQLQLKPVAILLTHGHFDHVLGLLELRLAWGLNIWMHEADVPILKTAAQSAEHWLGHPVDPVPMATHFYQEDQVIPIGREILRVLPTPGHTPGSVSLYNQDMIFSGDTLFAHGVGRTDFSYSSPFGLADSLKKLEALDQKLFMYAGHGEASTLAQAFKELRNPSDANVE